VRVDRQRSGTETVAEHIAGGLSRTLPDSAVDAGKRAILDSLVAMLSGATLEAGRLAARYVGSYGSTGEASVIGSGARVRPELAALANGMSAHADETDDVHDLARMHPGASIVPAALALAETEARSGSDWLRAVVLGYDIGCAISIGAYRDLPTMQRAYRSPHSLGQPFGAAAAAACLADLDTEQITHVLSYTADQASGFTSFYRDERHLEKAFSSAGMQAHSGVRAVEMVRHGFTAVDDILDGTPSVFDVFGEGGSVEGMLTALRGQHFVELTDLKRYPVGMPIQAAAEAMEAILTEHPFEASMVEKVVCRLPPHGARIVNARSMPDINIQYALSVIMMNGTLTFENAHDYAYRNTPAMSDLVGRVELVADTALDGLIDGHVSSRRAIVEVTLKDGRQWEHRVTAARGSRLHPLDWEQVREKADRILGGIWEPSRIRDLCSLVDRLEDLDDVRSLRPILAFAR
jgi:2-methylcitrate dehydratase PrpD